MKTTKKFLVFSTLVISVLFAILLATCAIGCIIIVVLSLLWGFWKEAVVAVALGYLFALGAFSFWDTSDWFANIYRRLRDG